MGRARKVAERSATEIAITLERRYSIARRQDESQPACVSRQQTARATLPRPKSCSHAGLEHALLDAPGERQAFISDGTDRFLAQSADDGTGTRLQWATATRPTNVGGRPWRAMLRYWTT